MAKKEKLVKSHGDCPFYIIITRPLRFWTGLRPEDPDPGSSLKPKHSGTTSVGPRLEKPSVKGNIDTLAEGTTVVVLDLRPSYHRLTL